MMKTQAPSLPPSLKLRRASKPQALGVLAVLLFATAAFAQQPKPAEQKPAAPKPAAPAAPRAEGSRPAGTEDVEVEPITCWWRATTTAVRAGEPFGLTLTCSVVEAEAMKVVPDFSKLDPQVVQLPPFEILGGNHPGDLTTPGKRYFQYEYRLRAIPEEAFGSDLAIPPLEITYRIQSKVSNGDSVEGRDLTYLLPRTSVRLISLVPDDASDIREAPAAGFLAIESRSSRANVYQTISTLLFGLAGLVAVMILFGLLRTRTSKSEKSRALLHNRAILAGVSRELAEVQRESRGGWTPELAGRALAGLRIAGSYATGRPVGQSALGATPGVDGELAIGGSLGRRGALVSGSVTSVSVNGSETPATRGLADALQTLTVIRYGRESKIADADEALDTAIRITREQQSAHSIAAEWSRAIAQSLVNARKRVWA